MTGKKEGLGGVDGGWGGRRGEGDRGWGRPAGGAPLLYDDNAKPGKACCCTHSPLTAADCFGGMATLCTPCGDFSSMTVMIIL